MKLRHIIGILVIGLFTAILIYPLLHEIGHSVAAILVGGRVCEIKLLPLPYMTCDVSEIGSIGMAVIGISGMLVPVLTTWLIYMKNFWIWLIGLYMNFICFLSFSISLYGCITYIAGKPLVNEDITKVIELCPDKVWIWIIVFSAFIVCIAIQVIITKPIQHCCDYESVC